MTNVPESVMNYDPHEEVGDLYELHSGKKGPQDYTPPASVESSDTTNAFLLMKASTVVEWIPASIQDKLVALSIAREKTSKTKEKNPTPSDEDVARKRIRERFLIIVRALLFKAAWIRQEKRTHRIIDETTLDIVAEEFFSHTIAGPGATHAAPDWLVARTKEVMENLQKKDARVAFLKIAMELYKSNTDIPDGTHKKTEDRMQENRKIDREFAKSSMIKSFDRLVELTAYPLNKLFALLTTKPSARKRYEDMPEINNFNSGSAFDLLVMRLQPAGFSRKILTAFNKEFKTHPEWPAIEKEVDVLIDAHARFRDSLV